MHITLLRTMVHNNSYVYLYVRTYVATFWQIMNLLHDGLQRLCYLKFILFILTHVATVM